MRRAHPCTHTRRDCAGDVITATSEVRCKPDCAGEWGMLR